MNDSWCAILYIYIADWCEAVFSRPAVSEQVLALLEAGDWQAEFKCWHTGALSATKIALFCEISKLAMYSACQSPASKRANTCSLTAGREKTASHLNNNNTV